MRILCSGAAGFIGSSLGDALAEDHAFWGFDNFLTGRENNWPDAENIDIIDRGALYAYANEKKPDVVIHCAASYSDPDKWHRDTQVNIEGGINAALVAKHHGAHLIYFQTILPPISSYAISKIAAEQYMRLSGVPLTVLRLANIYGPRNLSGPIPTFYKRMRNEQPIVVVNTSRDFLFIEDLVRAVEKVVTERLIGTYDVCSGIQTSIYEIWQRMWLMMRPDAESPPLIPPDPDDVQGTVSPANWIPGWLPEIPMDQGMAKTYGSYVESGVSETHTHLRIGEKDAS